MMQKNRHLGTIAQLCRAISSQLRHVSTIGKKLVKQQYLPHMSLQYGELWPTSGWDRFVSLGTPANLNGFRVFVALLHGTLVVGVSQSAALNRGRHLYAAGRPSRWALAHILFVFELNDGFRIIKSSVRTRAIVALLIKEIFSWLQHLVSLLSISCIVADKNVHLVLNSVVCHLFASWK